MSLTKQQALEMFQSDDLIGIGMEADAVRRRIEGAKATAFFVAGVTGSTTCSIIRRCS